MTILDYFNLCIKIRFFYLFFDLTLWSSREHPELLVWFPLSQKLVIDDTKSKPSPVPSGVPPGTLLDPLLFLAYINDMPVSVLSTIKQFADDSLLYRKIKNPRDCACSNKILIGCKSGRRTGKWLSMLTNVKSCA